MGKPITQDHKMKTAQKSMPSGWANEYELSDAVLNPSGYRGGISSFGMSGILYNLNNETNHLRAYNECPPLKSIVAKRAKAFNVGKIDVYNKNNGKPAQNSDEAKAFRSVLKTPNPLQTQSQFFAQLNTYTDVFGYCPVFIVRPYGMNSEVSAIWNIPPWLFDVEYTGNWLMQDDLAGIFKNFKMSIQSGSIPLPTANLKLIFDDGFGTDMDISLCIPDSRLRSQELPVSNIIAALKSRNTLITRRGPMGILSNGSKDAIGPISLPEGEKKAVQTDFSRYGIVGQEFQIIITEANLQWQQMGFSTKDLMLFEEVEADINMLCDAFGYPNTLMAQAKGATYENQERAEKGLFNNTIIPECESRLQQLSNALMGANSNLCYLASFDHAPALQAERLETANARKENDTALEKEFKNNVITLNMWLEVLEMPTRTDGNGDKYYYELIQLGWEFGNTGLNGGDTNPTTPPNAGLPGE
jgi:hypothetical protein